MSKRSLVLFSLALTLTLVLTSIGLANGVTYFEDSTNDVFRYEDGTLIAKGDFANEIDVVSVTLIGTELTLNLAADPKTNDGFHSYEIVIVWDNISQTIQNKTEITVGNVDGAPFVDVMTNYLVNATGHPLASQPAPIYNSTQVKNQKLVWEMDVCLYQYTSYVSPMYVNVTTKYTTEIEGKNVLFMDTHLKGETPTPPGIIWNFSTILSVAGTLLVCGFAGYTLGQISVYYFTTNIRSKQTNTIFMAVFVVGLAVLVNFWFWLTPWQILWNVGIFLITIVFGYYWATRGLMRLKFDSPLPENLPIDTEEQLSACIVLSKGESEDYNPLPYIRRFYKKEETNVEQKSKFLQPIELYKIKRQYKKLFKLQAQKAVEFTEKEVKNPYRDISKDITEKLEETFLDYDMYINAYVNDWPTINQVLLTAIARGASNITILNLFTSHSFEYELAINEMKRIDYSKIGLNVKQTDFLGKSKKIQNYLIKKVKVGVPEGSDLAKVGVLLISEGQPKEWDSLYSLTEEEETFKKAITQGLQKAGFKEQNVRPVWLNYRPPQIEDAVQELVASGCQTIIAAVTSEPIDGLLTLYNVPTRVEKAIGDESITVITIGGWNVDDEIIKVYLSLITNAKALPLEELGKEAEIVLQASKVGATLKEAEDHEEDKHEENKSEDKNEEPSEDK
ncbi:MAG: hypothetical protein ACTSXO_11220 [Candidatus Heimdallarchaeota archaeon]